MIIEVADDGPGMTEEVRARAFEPFFTTKARGEGTGLGLSMVQRLVHNASGILSLDTAVGKGTRVRLDLPVAPSPVVLPDPAAAPAAATAIRGARLLVVEDDPQVRRVLERILRRADYDVTSTSTVAEARATLDARRFDVLVTDGQLPDGNAGAVIEAYRVQHGSGPVVVCTGYLDDKQVLATLGHDAASVLVQKPFETKALLELIARLAR